MTVAMRNVNVYFDVVGTNPQHLRFAIDKIGAHRIMFGTDWFATMPMPPRNSLRQPIEAAEWAVHS